MNRCLTRIALATTLAVTAVGAASATAAADTVTMGSTLVSNYDGGMSSARVLSAQLSYDPATSPNPVISPANGVITGWKVKSADDGALYTLRVLRPNGPVSLVPATNSNFTAVGSVAGSVRRSERGPAPPTPRARSSTIRRPLPISKGDYVGARRRRERSRPAAGNDERLSQRT